MKPFWPLFVGVGALGAAVIWTRAPELPLTPRWRSWCRAVVARATGHEAEYLAEEPAYEIRYIVQKEADPPLLLHDDEPVTNSVAPKVSATKAPQKDYSPARWGIFRRAPQDAQWGVTLNVSPVYTSQGKMLGNVKGGRVFRINALQATSFAFCATGDFSPKKIGKGKLVYVPVDNLVFFSGDPDKLSGHQRDCLRNYYEIAGEMEALKNRLMIQAAEASPFFHPAAEALSELKRMVRAAGRIDEHSDAGRKAHYAISQQQIKVTALNDQHRTWKDQHPEAHPDLDHNADYQALLARQQAFAAPISELVR